MVTTITDRLYGESSGVAVKAPVVAVASIPISLNGLGAIQTPVGSYAPNVGDRILVANQTDPTTNGIYNASVSGWTRAGDFDGAYDVVQGSLIVVVLPNAQTLFYQLTTQNPVTIGSSPLTFQAFYNPNAFYPQTAAEITAGVTIVNYGYEPLDTRRYGWVNDYNGVTGTNNYTALANALLVAGQTVPGATVRIRGGGTNQALVQGSTTISWPDYVGIEFDAGVQVFWNDNNTGAYCLTNGAAGARHGSIFSKNLSLVLGTQTACGVHFINTIFSTHLNFSVAGFAGDYATRTNVGLKMEATSGEGCWFNDFYTLDFNHCHIGVLMPASSAGLTTQNTFRNLRHYGDGSSGDTNAVAMSIAGSDYGIVDGFWIENLGASGYGFQLQGVSGWRIDNGTFDTSSATYTAISEDSGCSGNYFGKRLFLAPGARVVNAAAVPANGAINAVEAVQGGVNGNAFTPGRQNALGLLDAAGLAGSYFAPGGGGIAIGGVQNTMVGGCVNPCDNLLYIVTKQGYLAAYSPPFGQITNWVQFSASSGDGDVQMPCYCPSNGYIYIPDRQDKSIVIVNPRTMTVVQTLSLTATAGAAVAPYACAYCPSNGRIYVANNGVANISIVNPTANGTDSVVQTLAGFTGGTLGVAYCPITQKVYVGGNSTSIFVVTPTSGGADTIAQTLTLTGASAVYAVAYCPFNQKMYAVSYGTNTFISINPTTGGTDSILTTGHLVQGATSATGTRGIAWSEAARAMYCAGIGNLLATITPSLSGSADINPQLQNTAGGSTLSVVYHPSYGKVYEMNSLLSYIPEWS